LWIATLLSSICLQSIRIHLKNNAIGAVSPAVVVVVPRNLEEDPVVGSILGLTLRRSAKTLAAFKSAEYWPGVLVLRVAEYD
jgi:hypothetical protein